MRESYLSAGARLSYTQAGAGLPVVFLHPTPLDHDYWRPLVAELDDIQAFLPDFRGHGGSELGSLAEGGFSRVPNAPVLTMTRLALDVQALLDALGIKEAVFAGCSVGGYQHRDLREQSLLCVTYLLCGVALTRPQRTQCVSCSQLFATLTHTADLHTL